jgi:hypothetical protein
MVSSSIVKRDCLRPFSVSNARSTDFSISKTKMFWQILNSDALVVTAGAFVNSSL